MSKSTEPLGQALACLTRRARSRGLTDSAWAACAGIPKETLSRLRGRESCDFGTLCALANALGARVGVLEGPACDATADGHFPLRVDREYEERLLELCASGDLDAARWASAGPRFFMAGLAVMLAGSGGQLDRRGLLALAERLHPGASEVAVFQRWLTHTPVRPDRFLPLLDARLAHAA